MAKQQGDPDGGSGGDYSEPVEIAAEVLSRTPRGAWRFVLWAFALVTLGAMFQAGIVTGSVAMLLWFGLMVVLLVRYPRVTVWLLVILGIVSVWYYIRVTGS
jgi:hypothetical protein